MLWPTFPHAAWLRENSQVGGEVEQHTIPGRKLEMVLQDIRESGQRPVMAILGGGNRRGRLLTCNWPTEDKSALGNTCFDFLQQEFRNHSPCAPILRRATLAQKLLLSDSKPQSGPCPGVYTFLNCLDPFTYTFIRNFLQRLWYSGVSEVPK